MRFSGERRFELPRDELWRALHDPDVLARALPGCESFVARDEVTYAGTLTLGVAGARGTYRGKVEEVEVDAPGSYRLLVTAAGAPGAVEAATDVHLEEDGDATVVRFEVDASLSGGAAAMGGQLLATAADRTAARFLDDLERVLTQDPSDADDASAGPSAAVGPHAATVPDDASTAPDGAPVSGDVEVVDGRARWRRVWPAAATGVVAVVLTLLVRRVLAR